MNTNKLEKLQSLVETVSIADIQSNAVAVGNYVTNIDDFEMPLDPDTVFDGENEVIVWEPLENDPSDLIHNYVHELKDSVKRSVGYFTQWAQRGLVISAMNGSLDLDANSWDLDQMAMLGFVTDKVIEIDGHNYSFDMSSLEWQREGLDKILDFDKATGLPIMN